MDDRVDDYTLQHWHIQSIHRTENFVLFLPRIDSSSCSPKKKKGEQKKGENDEQVGNKNVSKKQLIV